ncbi:hypothetical protein L4X63_09255 [Geomonas sp. Red32]|uniref:hypothetical protein n=1 Tax=Geomonas sp. Red32 TaxID=2912856 RepID=UPI00202CADD2|nr:hypothetical protein [Geomonas sp. Red32]MCM0081775.1 hypothetical protein [Geomonas sp. Red32]
MLTEKCTFPKGMIVTLVVDDEEIHKIVRDFVLQEETMEHTFVVLNDLELDAARMKVGSYFQAAVISARVKIEGVNVTPEMILDLDPADGLYLMAKTDELEARRAEFRKKIATLPEGHHPPEKTRVRNKRNPGHEPGRGERVG